MKKLFLLLVVFSFVRMAHAADGAIASSFSVGLNKQVQFSKGNLQYMASTKTWRFAEHQYDLVGTRSDFGNVKIGDVQCENEYIASDYDGWIDLFGWGTGTNPTNTSEDENDYVSFAEYGNNPIINGGNASGSWRTLSEGEWLYLLMERDKAAKLYGLGTIKDVHGLILLPDNWVQPISVSFNPSTENGLEPGLNPLYFYNEETNNFNHNIYTEEQWEEMEKNGAVFLPTTGVRTGVEVHHTSEIGWYWTKTLGFEGYANYLRFSGSDLSVAEVLSVCDGIGVRLVRNNNGSTTGMESYDALTKSVKVLINGQLFIQRNNTYYDLTGKKIAQ